jgi:hypothetical protein
MLLVGVVGLLAVGGIVLLVVAFRSASKSKSAEAVETSVTFKGRPETALTAAVEMGHTNLVRELLDKGADANAKSDDGKTMLYIASREGNSDVVQALLDKGADVNAKGSNGATALMVASQNGRVDVVRALIDKGADINAKMNGGWTALLLASGNDLCSVVELLLDKGADANAKSSDGTTALIAAKSADIRALLRQVGISEKPAGNCGTLTNPRVIVREKITIQESVSHPTAVIYIFLISIYLAGFYFFGREMFLNMFGALLLYAVVGGIIAVFGPTLLGITISQNEREVLRTQLVEDSRDALIKFMGFEPQYIDTQAAPGILAPKKLLVGTGIAYGGGCVYIMNDGEIARIPWALVRSWRWSIEGYSTTEFVGKVEFVDRLRAYNIDEIDMLSARNRSGFFVTVADVEKPVWQFTEWNKAVLEKWDEIFT